MSTSATLQHTVQIRSNRFAALLVAVATLTAVTTWAVGNITDSQSSSPKAGVTSSPSSDTEAYVDGVTALTPEQQAAIYGNLTASQQHVDEITALSPGELAAIYGNVSPTEQYVDGVTALTPEQQAAIYGNVPTFNSTP